MKAELRRNPRNEGGREVAAALTGRDMSSYDRRVSRPAVQIDLDP
jgi:hypothetical protein